MFTDRWCPFTPLPASHIEKFGRTSRLKSMSAAEPVPANDQHLHTIDVLTPLRLDRVEYPESDAVLDADRGIYARVSSEN